MDQELKRIEHCKGMQKKGMKTKDMPVKSRQGTEIAEDVRAATDTEKLPELGEIYVTLTFEIWFSTASEADLSRSDLSDHRL